MLESPTPDPAGQTVPRSRAVDLTLAAIAWLVLLVIFALTVVAQNSPDASTAHGPGMGIRIAELQAKYLVGTARFVRVFSGPASQPGAAAGSSDGEADLAEAAEMLDGGSIAQRLRYIALVGELGGPTPMLAAAERLRGAVAAADEEFDGDEESVLEALERVASRSAERQEALAGSSAPPQTTEPIATPEEATLLRAQLGWFGELAVAPRIAGDTPQRAEMLAPTTRVLVALLGVVAFVCVAALGGLVGLIVLIVFVAMGASVLRLRTGAPRASVYIETFTLWMIVFTALAAIIVGAGALDEIGASLVAMLGSLVVLAWPVVRGIPFRQVRRDLGLHTGAGVVREAMAGVAAYAMSLPLLAIGVVAMFGLMALDALVRTAGADEGGASPFAPNDGPSHPLIDLLADSGPAGIVAAALLAVVVAPLVEETMFRGVLYRHLREGTRRAGTFLSIAAAALVAAFIFAAIHPQGWVTIPALMALACGFTLAREWRDSLIAGMVAHGLNNGLIVTILLAAFA